MESKFVALRLVGSEAEWLRNLLVNILLIKDMLSLVSIHNNCPTEIATVKNKFYNCKSRHMKLRHDAVK